MLNGIFLKEECIRNIHFIQVQKTQIYIIDHQIISMEHSLALEALKHGGLFRL